MKPLNLDNSPCSPTSSNCVIWQGPDLACIKLCKGDTVSDVVAKLATELCTILDQLNVNNYDLSCFNSTACPPVDFQALIQFLINHICALEGVTPVDTNKNVSACPDCVVSVASCFVQGNQTTMQLVDYVQMIGERICRILTDIANLQVQITNLDNRVTILENAPAPTFTLPSILVDCTLQASPLIGNGGGATPIDAVLSALINDDTYGYCALTTATGLPADILTAVNSQCITSATDSLVYGTPMGTAYSGSWVNDPENVADSITNLWIALCDAFEYLSNNELSVVDTTTVNLTYTAGVLSAAVQDTGWHCLLGFDFYSDDATMLVKKPQVRRIGNVLHFRGTLTIPLASYTVSGAVVEWLYKAGTNTYEGVASTSSPAHGKSPYQGTGGVSLLSGGALQFNKGANVIPTEVLPVGYDLDASYSIGWRMGWRNMDTGACSTILTTLANVSISPAGLLTWGTLADLEESFVTGCNDAWSTSVMNYTISHVTAGQYVPDFKAAGSNTSSDATTGVQGIDVNFSANTYPITINADNYNDLGGFSIILDGLTAFIGPCVTAIPTPTLDANACAGTCAVG